MIQRSDPLERLRAVNPVSHERARPSVPDPVLFGRITSGHTPVPQLRRRRARRLAPVLVAGSLLGGAVAYAVVRDGVTRTQSVACYKEADLQALSGAASVDKRGPLAACADLWRRGTFGPAGEVPVLAQCVLDTGVAAVFPTAPGEDVCARLGLVTVPSTVPLPPAATPADPAQRFVDFREAVLPQFLEAGCLEPGAAEGIVRRELERAGLGDWTVRAQGFSGERPCASLSFLPDVREVVLVPSPPRR